MFSLLMNDNSSQKGMDKTIQWECIDVFSAVENIWVNKKCVGITHSRGFIYDRSWWENYDGPNPLLCYYRVLLIGANRIVNVKGQPGCLVAMTNVRGWWTVVYFGATKCGGAHRVTFRPARCIRATGDPTNKILTTYHLELHFRWQRDSDFWRPKYRRIARTFILDTILSIKLLTL